MTDRERDRQIDRSWQRHATKRKTKAKASKDTKNGDTDTETEKQRYRNMDLDNVDIEKWQRGTVCVSSLVLNTSLTATA